MEEGPTLGSPAPGVARVLQAEAGLFASVATAALFSAFSASWFADLADPLWLALLFAWLFGVVLWSAFAVVRHAEALASALGEPYGTLILTLSVISIEVAMISAVMITGADNPTLARDTMYAVVMIVLNGMVGVTLLGGGLRYREQTYNLQGANSFLALIVPLAVIAMVLPNYTRSTSGPTFSHLQADFLVVGAIGLYAVFLAIQTVRHRGFFVDERDDGRGHHGEVPHSPWVHALLLAGYLLPIVLLAKKLAVPISWVIERAGAPPALGGFVVATLVLSPEALGAVRAALGNQLQRAVNIFLGSVAATISLTVPAVLVVAALTGEEVYLGLDPAEEVMLALTLVVSIVTFSGGRTNIFQGAVHLVLFLTYVLLLFD